MMSSKILSELEMVARRGAESASSSLSKFIGQTVAIKINGDDLVDIGQIPEQMGHSEALAVGLLTRVKGSIEGNAVLLFGTRDAGTLVRHLGGKGCSQDVEAFGEMERSILEETGNITMSSFMNSITFHLDKKCVPNAPVFLRDLAGAIISVVIMESAEVSDQAICISTSFLCAEKDLEAVFYFLLSPSSLHVLEDSLK